MDFLGLWPNRGENAVPNLFFIHIRSTLGNTNTVSVFVTIAVLFTGFLYIRKKSKWQPLWLCASALSFWMWDVANADSGTIGMAAAMLLCIPFIIQTLKTLGRTLILVSTWVAAYTIQFALFDVNILGQAQINQIVADGTIQLRSPSALLPLTLIFAVLLAVGLLFNLKGKEVDPNAPPKWKLGVILIVVFIVLGLVGVEVLGRPDADGTGSGVIFEAREVMHGNIQDEFGTNRIFIWRNALTVFPNNPIIGTGPDTFGHAFPRDAHGVFGEFYENAHNEYIQYLITHGIVGLLFYLAFVGSIVLRSVKKAFNDPIIMAVLAAFVGYLAQAFFNISHPIASQILWIFAGILVSRRLSQAGKFEP
jgi:O-antigen ligase